MSSTLSERKREIKRTKIALLISIIILIISFVLSFVFSNYNIIWTILISISGFAFFLAIILVVIYIVFIAFNKQSEEEGQIVFGERQQDNLQLSSEIIDIHKQPDYKEPQNISLMKRRKFKAQEGESFCRICKLQIRANQFIFICSQCNSYFHENHLREWIELEDNCPVCGYRIMLKS